MKSVLKGRLRLKIRSEDTATDMAKDNLLNTVTRIRMVFIPFFVIFILVGNIYTRMTALLIFVADCLIDIYKNRDTGSPRHSISNRGIMSVLIDKLLISSAFICFAGMRELSIPVWMVILIVLNEYVTSGLKNIAASRKDNVSIKMNPKSRFFSKGGIIVILIILIVKIILNDNPQIIIADANKFLLEAIPYWVTLVIAGFSAASGINCVKRNIKVIQEGGGNE